MPMTPISWFQILTAASCATALCLAGCGGSRDGGGDPAAGPGRGDTPRISTVRDSRPAGVADASRAGRSSARPADDAALQAGAGPGKTLFTGRVTMADASALDTTVTVTVTPTRGTMAHYEEDEPTTAAVGNDGLYRVAMDSPFCAAIRVDGDGLLAQSVAVLSDLNGTVSETPPVVVHDFAMERGAELSGRFVDADGVPLSGDLVAVWGDNPNPYFAPRAGKPFVVATAEAEATADMGFRLFVAPGEVRLGATADGFGAVRMNVTAPASGLEVRFGKGATIEGAVFRRGSGEGVPDASVRMFRTEPEDDPFLPRMITAACDGLGAFRFRGVADGSYAITAGKDRLLPWTGKGALTQLTVADGADTAGLVLFLFPGYTVSGRVTEKETGAPLEGVEIDPRFRKDSAPKSGPDGRYRVEGIGGDDQVLLTVRKEGFRAAVGRYSPGVVATSTLEFPVGETGEVSGDFEMVRNPTVSGRVRRANGDGIPGALVSLAYVYGDDFTTTNSAADGTFNLELPPNTVCMVKVRARGCAPGQSGPVDVIDRPVTDVVVTLRPGGTLGGVVVDPDGNPVPDAVVTSSNLDEDKFFAMTDDRGRFVLQDQPTDGVTVGASKKGFANSLRIDVTVAENESRDDLRIELRKAHHVAGRVLDTAGKLVSGASVSLQERNGSSGDAVSDMDGRYRVGDLAEGTYNGYCHALGEAVTVSDVEVRADRDDVDIVIGEAEKADSVEVIGRVLDWKSRAPVEAFRVNENWPGLDTDTGRPGEFRMAIPPGVPRTLTVVAEGYVDCTREIEVEPGYGDGKEFEFLMGPGGTVTGRVVSKDDKAPMGGIQVVLQSKKHRGFGDSDPTAKTAITAADGRFTMNGVAIGPKELSVRPPEGRVAVKKNVGIEHGKVTDAGDIEIGSGGTIRVRVVRSPGDVPVPGVQIQIFGESTLRTSLTPLVKLTDADGHAVFPHLDASSYSVMCSDPPMTGHVVLNGESTVDVVLRAGEGTLRGKVTFEGNALHLGAVSLTRQSGEAGACGSYMSPVDEGRYEIGRLPEGTYRAVAQLISGGTGNPRAEATLQIRSSGEQVHDFVLPSGRLVGRVVDSAGNPMPNASISMSEADPQSPQARMHGGSRWFRSANKGEFVIRGLSGGAYNVMASKPGVGTAPLQRVEVPQDGESRLVTLKLETSQTGTVVSMTLNYTTGQPIRDVWCDLVTADGGRYEYRGASGADGLMTITEVPAGRYRAEIGSAGFSTGTRDIEVKAGETVRVDVVLHEAGSVRWTLTTSDGAPVAGAQCTITPDDPASIESPRSGVTAAHGIWGVPGGLLPGSYTATATAPGRQPARARMDVRAGELTEVITRME